MSDDTFRWVVAAGVAIATLSMLSMAVVSLILYRVVFKVQLKVDGIIDHVSPMIDSVRRLADQQSPKISSIVTSVEETAVNVKDISVIAKDQAHHFAEVGRDITDRAKVQVARVDAVMDDTVDQVHNIGNNVKSAVMKPVSEVSGVLAGIRAGVSAFANGHRPNIAHATQDEEMFI